MAWPLQMAAEEAELAAEALIGPPPPELVQEMDEVAGDAGVLLK